MENDFVEKSYKGKGIVNPRMYFLDNLKAFIILLMVVFHVAMGYATWDLKWWWVNDIKKDTFFDLFILETDVYIMPIMFMISGYFAALVLVNKKMAAFWKGKIRRIVIPWIGGVLFIAPFMPYSAIYSRTDTPPNYFSFWANDFFGARYEQGPFWFLGVLTLFFVLFSIAYHLKPSYFKKSSPVGIPSRWFFILFALFSAVPFFVTNLFFWCDAWVNAKYMFIIQPVRIGLYLCYFGLGAYAWKNSWFTKEGYNPRLLPWGISAVVMLVVFLVYRVTFTFPPITSAMIKIGHALTYSVFCLTVTFALIALFQRFADSDAYLWRRLSANSYTIYYIHPCILIPLSYIVQKLELSIWIKWLGVSITSVVLCFLISEYVINPVLSIKKKQKQADYLIN